MWQTPQVDTSYKIPRWKIHPTHALGHIISDVPGCSSGVSGLSTSYTLSQVTQTGVIKPRPVSQQRLATDHPFLFTAILKLFLSQVWWLLFSQPQRSERSVERAASKAPASNLQSVPASSPTAVSALINQTFVPSAFSFQCLFHSIFPGHSQFYQSMLFRDLKYKGVGLNATLVYFRSNNVKVLSLSWKMLTS